MATHPDREQKSGRSVIFLKMLRRLGSFLHFGCAKESGNDPQGGKSNRLSQIGASGPPLIDVEVCVQSDTGENVRRAVDVAYAGGAARIELCAAMMLDGLTPPQEHIRVAREAFRDRKGLVVMIRPRANDFHYTDRELRMMQGQIEMAARSGADGVVLGVLNADRRINEDALRLFMETARDCGLQVTFHRAFDATPNPSNALEILIACGVDRVLTCGAPWGQPGSALDALESLCRTAAQARDRIEVVVGGGVCEANIPAILRRVSKHVKRVSIHAYSGAQEEGVITEAAVKTLVAATRLP